ncbi:MFS transporter [Paenibacillus sp. SI8]|uniref:MFS transporter n=1 Tax=unclassified Paenibacillus TaxID=185978 RepID=UPI0034653C07
MTTQTASAVQQRAGLSKGATIFTFLLGIFMGALDHGIVGPALSSILSTYNVSPSWGVWSFTIYTLLFAVSIPIQGKLSDRFGRKPIFMAGILIFAAGSLIAAFAPNFTLFLLGRAVQAIGTGGIFPITAAQIAVSYPPEKRGKALGLIGVFFGVGTILGPVLGGLLIASLQWQWIFLINVPISIVILIVISRFQASQELVKKPIDFAGMVLLVGLIVSMMLGITQTNLWYLLAFIVILPIFIRIERRQKDPILKLGYLTESKTAMLLVSSLLSGFVMASAINMLPLYAETLLGLAKGSSGLTITPMAVSSMLASLLAGVLADKIGAKRVLLAGFALTALGAVSLVLLGTSVAAFIAIIVMMGFGVGIIIGAPLNVLMIQSVDLKETGAAIGYLSLFRSLGSTIGPTVAGILLVKFQSGFSSLYGISAAASVCGLLLVLIYVKRK